MPKVKSKQFPPVKVTEEFLTETKRRAEKADEYLSDYIRKAVDMRNSQYGGAGYIKDGEITTRKAEKNESKLEKVLSQKPEYPKTGYCNPIPKGK
jgi:hypothetical protein